MPIIELHLIHGVSLKCLHVANLTQGLHQDSIMSMEIFALSDRRLASMAEWQSSVDREGIEVVFPAGATIDDLRGFLPVRMNNSASGFECDHCAASEVMKLYGGIDFGREWICALAFNWHGFDEGLTAYVAASAYAKAANGIVFDPQEGIVMSPEQAFGVARQMEADMPKVKEALRVALRDLEAKRNAPR